MKIEPGQHCPLLDKPCIQLQCAWFQQIRGTDPQTGQDVDEWGCAVAWLPMLLIENAKQGRETGAAVESFRNAMVQSNQETLSQLVNTAAQLPKANNVS